MRRLADESLLVAYGATEPQAGSDLASLTTKAVPVLEDGQLTGYKITGRKQWISNGGVADLYTILALAPGGPSWFIVERDSPDSRRASRKTSMASAPATRRRCFSKMCSSRRIGWLAASKGRVWRRRRPSSATPA